MHVLAALLVVQSLAQGVQAPVLEFPEAGLDDPTAYEGYATRFFRDSRGNTFQVYLDTRAGRVVHVWADAANESAALTVRDTVGRPAPVVWGGPGAEAASDGRVRIMRYRLASEVGAVEIGWFLLGTMRQERDFQYLGWHRRPYGDPPFVLPELTGLLRSVERLPAAERARHLALLAARDVADLRARLTPRVTLAQEGSAWVVRVEHVSLDGRNHITLELRGDSGISSASRSADRVLVRPRSGARVELEVTVATDADPLTPLGRTRLFNQAFEQYYGRLRQVANSLSQTLGSGAARDARLIALRRLDRQLRGLELLSFDEKLLASMPNYATYFGRDMMMAALMLEPIASADLQELVITSVLRKLSPDGQVSHEEALGGQAIRENAAEYSTVIGAWERNGLSDPTAAARHLARARALLADLQAVRENYRMVDDDFQLPVLAARYLARPDVSAERKRRFLTTTVVPGRTRLDALMRNLAFVTELARPYAEQPTATNLVGFYFRDDEGWLPGSWRDSRVGYGGGRFALDVNAVWVPAALEALQTIVHAVDTLGLAAPDGPGRVPPDGSALGEYLRDPGALRTAVATWRGADRHFEVHLDPEETRQHVARALASLPVPEQDYWRRCLDESDAAARPLSFLAVALDEDGRPIPVANTDPATALFVERYTAEILDGTRRAGTVLELLDVVARPYPVGLFVTGLGPLVANDAYASSSVQERFRNDLYHSPRVVWGREVNLLLLGLTRQIEMAYDASGRLRSDSDTMRAYMEALRGLLERTRAAVEASGLRHNELWSYRIEDGVLRPVRYGTSSDIQLWNVTDLAVRFLLDRVPPR